MIMGAEINVWVCIPYCPQYLNTVVPPIRIERVRMDLLHSTYLTCLPFREQTWKSIRRLQYSRFAHSDMACHVRILTNVIEEALFTTSKPNGPSI